MTSNDKDFMIHIDRVLINSYLLNTFVFRDFSSSKGTQKPYSPSPFYKFGKKGPEVTHPKSQWGDEPGDSVPGPLWDAAF